MSRGQHAADDGSFQRSAGGAMARGIALIVAAVVLGVVLLRATDSPTAAPLKASTDATTVTPPGSVATSDGTTSTTPTTAATGAAAKPHTPSEVGVLVANGSGVKGAAAGLATRLKSANYGVKPSVNTTTTASASVVYYAPGYDADARAIAATLNPKPAVQPMPGVLPVKDLAKAQVLVVVAADLAGGH